MSESRSPRRRAWVIALPIAVVLVGIVAGIHPPAEEGSFRVVSWITGQSVATGSGWGFAPPLLARLIEFPAGPTPLAVRVGSPSGEQRLLSREGAAAFALVGITPRVEASGASHLARAFPHGWRPDEASRRFASGLERALGAFAAERSITEVLLTRGEIPALTEAARTAAGEMGLRLATPPQAVFYPRATADPGPGGAGGRRVLLIGLDGADWEIVDPLVAQGRMPNFGRLIATGARARLRTLTPSLSPIVWTSIATGVGPARHGIVDFVSTSAETGETIPVTSNMRRRKALWSILEDRGRTSGTIAWWATWPAEPVDGFMVSDRVAYQLFGMRETGTGLQHRTWPEALALVMQKHIVSPAQVEDEAIARFIPPSAAAEAPDYEDHVQRLKTILASSRTYTAIALDFLAAYDPDFKAIYLEGTDTVAHNFMRYRPPRMAGVSEAALAAYGGVVDAYYERADGILGQLLALADPGTVVIVCSDHGFRTGLNRPTTDPRIETGGAADWHRRFGILVMRGPGIAQGLELPVMSVLDIAPTVLALMGLAVPDDMEGRVIEEAFVMPPAPARIASYESAGGEGMAAPIPSQVDEEMLEKLGALGYVSQQGGNAWNNTGITFLEQGRYLEAAQAFRQAVQVEPGFLVARVNLGRALLLMKKSDEALGTLEAVQAEDDSIPDVSNLIANIHMDRGDLKQAEKALKRGLKRSPEDTNLLNSLGLLYDRAGRDEEAIRAFTRVVTIDPEYAEGYNNLGLTHRRRGETLEAITLFEKAVQADPAFPGSYNNMGLAYQDLGRLGEARAVLERGVAVDPENAIMRNTLGTILLGLQETAAAREEFERAIALDPSYAEPHNNLGAILASSGDPVGGQEHYRRAVDLDPNYLDARYNLANHLLGRGETDEAAAQLEDIVQRAPTYVNAWLQLGYIRLRAGDTERALAMADRALKMAPERVEPHNLLADIHLETGHVDDARRMLARSLEIDPNQPAVREALDRLRERGE